MEIIYLINDYLKTVIIAPIASAPKKYPTRIKVKAGGTQGMLALDQLRTIDKKRIIKIGNSISTKAIVNIKFALKEMLID